MKLNLRQWLIAPVLLLIAAACSDLPSAPESGPSIAVGTGSSSSVGCVQTEQGCPLEPVTVTGCMYGGTYPDCDSGIEEDYDICDFGACGGGGGGGGGGTPGGGTGGGGSPWSPADPNDQGPGAFTMCMATLLGLMVPTASLDPLGRNLWEARNHYHTTRNMYDAVMQNNADPATQQLWELRLEIARNGYHDAATNYALAVGATGAMVGAAAVACSPGMLLPTP